MIKQSGIALWILLFLCGCSINKDKAKSGSGGPKDIYNEMVGDFATGWNTWNYRSVFSHVLLPEAFALNLGIKDYYNKDVLREAMLGFDQEDLSMGPHAYDGSYTMVELHNWSETMGQPPINLRIQSAHAGEDLVILVEPLTPIGRLKKPLFLIEGGFIWNREGSISRSDHSLEASSPEGQVRVFTTGRHTEEHYINGSLSPFLAIKLEGPIGISTGRERSLDEIKQLVGIGKEKWNGDKEAYGPMSEIFEAVQTVMAWNAVYDPNHDRVISPVSRRWSLWNRGYVQYCWDTYFAAYLAAATGSREMAYINLVEMTRAKHKGNIPFVPNVEQANGFISRDRSQPPVGSMCAVQVYNTFGEKWILELLFEDLLEWNNWWHETRQHEGLLCYGSTPYDPVLGIPGESEANDDVNGWFGASKESGWDGALLYQHVPFDKERHFLKHWDASLNGLYIMDCVSLAQIADILGKENISNDLRAKAKLYQENLQRLWHSEKGFFFNRNWENMEFSEITAVNGFYPLIGGVATDEQATMVVRNYLMEADHFYGEWMVPTLSRSHPEFQNSRYWDGRVWPPVNFLVYAGLRNYDHIPEIRNARIEFVEKSRKLLLQRWRTDRYVQENYDVHTGLGEEQNQYSKFYHWGALLGLMSLIEEGNVPFSYPDELAQLEEN